MIISKKIEELNLTIILNAIGFAIFSGILFIVGFIAIFLISYKGAFWGSTVWVLIITAIGIIYKKNQWHDEQKTLETHWDINSVGSYVAHRELAKLTGPAYFISEVAMANAGCWLALYKARYSIIKLKGIDDSQVKLVTDSLKASAKGGKRFIPLLNADYNWDLVKILIYNEIIWAKIENGQPLIGINRHYENLDDA